MRGARWRQLAWRQIAVVDRVLFIHMTAQLQLDEVHWPAIPYTAMAAAAAAGSKRPRSVAGAGEPAAAPGKPASDAESRLFGVAAESLEYLSQQPAIDVYEATPPAVAKAERDIFSVR